MIVPPSTCSGDALVVALFWISYRMSPMLLTNVAAYASPLAAN